MDIRNFFQAQSSKKRKQPESSEDNNNNNDQNTLIKNTRETESPAKKRRRLGKSKFIEDSSDSDNDIDIKLKDNSNNSNNNSPKKNSKTLDNDSKVSESPLSLKKLSKPLESLDNDENESNQSNTSNTKSKIATNNNNKTNNNESNTVTNDDTTKNGNKKEKCNDTDDNDEKKSVSDGNQTDNNDNNKINNDGDNNNTKNETKNALDEFSSDDEDESIENEDEYDDIETDEDDDIRMLRNDGNDGKGDKQNESNGSNKSNTKSTKKSSKGKNNNKTSKSNKKSKKTNNKIFRGSKYDPVNDAGFKQNQDVPYIVIAKTFEKLEATTKRLEKIEIISTLFRSVIRLHPDQLLYTVYLCCNKIAPPYTGLELGVGDQVILKALGQSTGRALKDMKSDLTKCGDLGIVAEKSRSKQRTMFKPKPLTAKIVFDTFIKVASTSGNKSMEEKVRNIQRLFVSATENESRYIVRHLQGKMRMGVNEQTVLAALGRACAFEQIMQKNSPNDNDNDSNASDNEMNNNNNNSNDNNASNSNTTNTKKKKSPKKKGLKQLKLNATVNGVELEEILEKEIKYTNIMKQVISELPNYEIVIPKLIEYGIENLYSHCHLTAGIPVGAMLANPTKGVQEILKRFANMKFTLEYKYDGERAQIHFFQKLLNNSKSNEKTKDSNESKENAQNTKTEIKVFSRNCEDNTQKFPDLVSNMNRFITDDVTSFIIDSEVVAYDRELKKILPFQELTKRKRKDVKEEDISISVCIYAFDLLYLNGQSLIQLPFSERRSKLHEYFIPTEGEFAFADHKDTSEPEEITEFLNSAVEDYCEGLMVKTLDIDATYEPTKRSLNWLKCKKDYLDGVGDTLDLVVMGAFYGSGKRTGFYGSYLIGCYDEESDGYQSVTKVATGFKDDDLDSLTKQFKKILVDNKPMEYQSNLDCDVWFESKYVWEIRCADMTISPVHLGGIGIIDETKGIALRFPRYIQNRDDKTPEMATTAQQVVDMYKNQKQLQ